MKIPAGMPASSYKPAPFEETPTDPWREPWPEWTLDDTKHAARIATSRTRGGNQYSDARNTAWEGIAIHVTEHPNSSWLEAVNAGSRAISKDYGEALKGQRTDGASTGSRYAMYWIVRHDPSHTETHDELTAVHQVMAALPAKHQQTLLQRAAHESDTAMAEALGLTQSGVSTKVRAARTAFYRLWFDWETPPSIASFRPINQADTCRNGHQWSNNTQYVKTRHGRQRRCGSCNRETQQRLRKK